MNVDNGAYLEYSKLGLNRKIMLFHECRYDACLEQKVKFNEKDDIIS